ncbi:MAG: urea transporter [Spirochaetes bacterium]|nr:urea transporter [Spirochaetota bacterium]
MKTIPLVALKGLSQIMLQESPATGFLFLLGIFYGSWFMGVAAIIAVSIGTLTAFFLSYSRDEIHRGLYGFSAALVGVALALFFKPAGVIWLAIIVGSILATLLQHFFIERKIPVFTLPFVVVTWVLVFALKSAFPEHATILTTNASPVFDRFTFAFAGFGQVIFQDSLVAGVLFFIGVFYRSPVAALYGLAAAVVAGVLALAFSVPLDALGNGLFSYNAVLCAIVFAGDKVSDGLWVLLSIVLAAAIGLLFFLADFTALTFPFVAATWATLLARAGVLRFIAQPHRAKIEES